MFLVTGSQADRPENNKLTILQLSDLHKTYVSAGKNNYLKLFYKNPFTLIIIISFLFFFLIFYLFYRI